MKHTASVGLRNVAVVAVLVVVTVSVYAQVRHHDFVNLDDWLYILHNPHLGLGLSAESLALAFNHAHESYWLPLTWLSFQIDHKLYGLEPAGYLLTNVGLHALSTTLLFAVLWRMTRATWRSALVTAVFALHPLHVESVAWASERKDVLSGVFWMLTLHAYVSFVRRPTSGRHLLVLATLTLGLLSKPSLVTLPCVLLLLDYWPLARLGRGWPRMERVRGLLLEKVPLFLVAIAVSAVTFAMQSAGGGRTAAGRMSAAQTLMNVLESYGTYLVKTVLPTDLAAVYPLRPDALSATTAALSALALTAITVMVVRAGGARPYLPVGWLWFVGTLVPMIGIVHVGIQSHADRFMYVPLIGLAVAVAWALGDLVATHPRFRPWVAAAGLAAMGGMAYLSWIQVGYWKDTDTLFEHAVSVTEDNHFAHNRLAESYKSQLRLAEAEAQYVRTIRLAPWWTGPQLQLAALEEARGDEKTALALREAARRIALGADADAALGQAWYEAGRHDAALAHLRRAVAEDPESLERIELLADVLAALGRPDDAVEAAERGLAQARKRDDRPAAARLEEALAGYRAGAVSF